MVIWALADRALDIVGLGSLIYWTVKFTSWIKDKLHAWGFHNTRKDT